MSDKRDKKTSAFRFIKPSGNVVLEDSSAHHLLMFLCWAANADTGTSWHSQASIKSRTGMDARTVRKATARLGQLGLIDRQSQGKGVNLRYAVNHDKLVELAEAGKTLCAERRKSKQARDSHSTKLSYEAVQNCPTDVVQNCGTDVVQNCPTNLVINHEQSTTKEPDACASENSGEPVSGERERFDMTLDALEKEVARLKQLKQQAMSDRNLPAYNKLSPQLRERQQELNLARGAAFKKATAARSNASVTS
jgi:hypothetical protein